MNIDSVDRADDGWELLTPDIDDNSPTETSPELLRALKESKEMAEQLNVAAHSDQEVEDLAQAIASSVPSDVLDLALALASKLNLSDSPSSTPTPDVLVTSPTGQDAESITSQDIDSLPVADIEDAALTMLGSPT